MASPCNWWYWCSWGRSPATVEGCQNSRKDGQLSPALTSSNSWTQVSFELPGEWTWTLFITYCLSAVSRLCTMYKCIIHGGSHDIHGGSHDSCSDNYTCIMGATTERCWRTDVIVAVWVRTSYTSWPASLLNQASTNHSPALLGNKIHKVIVFGLWHYGIL